MMEYKRLTDKEYWLVACKKCIEDKNTCDEDSFSHCEHVSNAIDRLAELEDKIEQGTLIELPCKVGDTVYQTDGVRIYESKVELLIYDCGRWAFNEKAIGTSVFLTREEAEKRLKELQE